MTGKQTADNFMANLCGDASSTGCTPGFGVLISRKSSNSVEVENKIMPSDYNVDDCKQLGGTRISSNSCCLPAGASTPLGTTQIKSYIQVLSPEKIRYTFGYCPVRVGGTADTSMPPEASKKSSLPLLLGIAALAYIVLR